MLTIHFPFPISHFQPESIGKVLSLYGIGFFIISAWVFPLLQLRFGTLRLYRVSLSCFPLAAVLFPVVQRIARAGDESATRMGVGAVGALKCWGNTAYV